MPDYIEKDGKFYREDGSDIPFTKCDPAPFGFLSFEEHEVDWSRSSEIEDEFVNRFIGVDGRPKIQLRDPNNGWRVIPGCYQYPPCPT